ncbi:MAG TPA: DNA mismatch repair endonuclease MutL [Bryobacteraceae bacterium]|jgi:DNA mismatch repair protein MutL|nr:DNA mismatch repair endonuclease MutL [Bryobacteraceae bacterium]
MGRIHILSDNVANKIAAGEVVERPASVAKELLENALDAGATEIRIDTENAGRRLIRIQDDGHGMLRDDALLAFERHATSKLSDVKDLLSIATLGFRGEALPSIASVSRLILETRSADEQTGTAVEIAGGKLLRCDEIARTIGTTITVRDLFYNVPARKKFLRSDQTELAHIGSLVTHYSLGHTNKRFELFHEGRELLTVTPVSGLRDRAFQVFGAGLMQDLIDFEPRTFDVRLNSQEPETACFSLEGLISAPHVQKNNRNNVFLFVNGRLIKDRVLLHALTAAYHNLMPPGCFPFALLFLNCDPGEVDVNVHPSKTEVRFRHSPVVHDFVRDTVREVLMESRPVSSFPIPPSSPVLAPPAFANPAPAARAPELPYSEFSARMELFDPEASMPPQNEPAPEQMREAALPEIVVASHSPRPVDRGPAAAPLSQPKTGKIPDTHSGFDHLPADWQRVDTLAALPDLRPLGQLHDSFIIAAARDGLWIIDQHVAHERILFEQVLHARAQGSLEVQQLLMPLVLQLTPSQQFEYARIADELVAHGFDCEPFGQRTVAVKSAPAAIGPADIEKILFEILDLHESDLRPMSLDELRRNVCATIACRAAIKINMRLEPKKIEWLLGALAGCEYPMTCPHGRPIALRYSTKDILKSFHRI